MGGLLAGLLADLFGRPAAVGVIAALTALSGLIVAVVMRETLTVRQPVLSAAKESAVRMVGE